MQYKSLPDIYVQTAALEILNVDKTVRMNQLSEYCNALFWK